MKKTLEFNIRIGDLALEACPKYLVKLDPWDKNTTIDFVRYYRNENGEERKLSVGYFRYNDREPCWELRWVGDRFTKISQDEITQMWPYLVEAYKTLERFSEQNRR